jgi:hypothetical protein
MLDELPKPLATYLRINHWYTLETAPYLTEYILEERQTRGLRYLQRFLEEAEIAVRISALGNDYLLDGLRGLPQDPSPSMVVSEVIRRIEAMSTEDKTRVITNLAALVHENEDRSRAERVVIDRAALRLLHHFEMREAFALAARCADSSRAMRRQAAYRFYMRQGLDDAGRDVLVRHFGTEGNDTYRKLITTDSLVVSRIGIENILRTTRSGYWRQNAIESLMAQSTDDIPVLAEEYPEEVLWAISDQRRTDLVEVVLTVLRAHRDDAYLVNRVVQCLTRLGDIPALAEAAQVGRNLIEQAQTRAIRSDLAS